MTTSPVLTIVGMAVATYLTRITGHFLAARLPQGGRTEAFLQAVPGSVLMAIIAPVALASGLPEALASAVTVVAAWKIRNLAVAMAAGVLTVYLLRQTLGA